MEDQMMNIIVCVILGAVAAIAYSLRVLYLMERRIARIDVNIDKIARRILEEEVKIEEEEKKLEKMVGRVIKKGKK